MTARDDRDRRDPTGFEVDRHVDEQPPREDLLDPHEIEGHEIEGHEIEDLEAEDLEADDTGLDPDALDTPARTGDPEVLPDPEELPESQGVDALTAERLVEDHADRPPMHDEPSPSDEDR